MSSAGGEETDASRYASVTAHAFVGHGVSHGAGGHPFPYLRASSGPSWALPRFLVTASHDQCSYVWTTSGSRFLGAYDQYGRDCHTVSSRMPPTLVDDVETFDMQQAVKAYNLETTAIFGSTGGGATNKGKGADVDMVAVAAAKRLASKWTSRTAETPSNAMGRATSPRNEAKVAAALKQKALKQHVKGALSSSRHSMLGLGVQHMRGKELIEVLSKTTPMRPDLPTSSDDDDDDTFLQSDDAAAPRQHTRGSPFDALGSPSPSGGGGATPGTRNSSRSGSRRGSTRRRRSGVATSAMALVSPPDATQPRTMRLNSGFFTAFGEGADSFVGSPNMDPKRRRVLVRCLGRDKRVQEEMRADVSLRAAQPPNHSATSGGNAAVSIILEKIGAHVATVAPQSPAYGPFGVAGARGDEPEGASNRTEEARCLTPDLQRQTVKDVEGGAIDILRLLPSMAAALPFDNGTPQLRPPAISAQGFNHLIAPIVVHFGRRSEVAKSVDHEVRLSTLIQDRASMAMKREREVQRTPSTGSRYVVPELQFAHEIAGSISWNKGGDHDETTKGTATTADDGVTSSAPPPMGVVLTRDQRKADMLPEPRPLASTEEVLRHLPNTVNGDFARRSVERASYVSKVLMTTENERLKCPAPAKATRTFSAIAASSSITGDSTLLSAAVRLQAHGATQATKGVTAPQSATVVGGPVEQRPATALAKASSLHAAVDRITSMVTGEARPLPFDHANGGSDRRPAAVGGVVPNPRGKKNAANALFDLRISI